MCVMAITFENRDPCGTNSLFDRIDAEFESLAQLIATNMEQRMSLIMPVGGGVGQISGLLGSNECSVGG